MTDVTDCSHRCGVCDGLLFFDHFDGPVPSWTCHGCGAWHTAKDCCEREPPALLGIGWCVVVEDRIVGGDLDYEGAIAISEPLDNNNIFVSLMPTDEALDKGHRPA